MWIWLWIYVCGSGLCWLGLDLRWLNSCGGVFVGLWWLTVDSRLWSRWVLVALGRFTVVVMVAVAVAVAVAGKDLGYDCWGYTGYCCW